MSLPGENGEHKKGLTNLKPRDWVTAAGVSLGTAALVFLGMKGQVEDEHFDQTLAITPTISATSVSISAEGKEITSAHVGSAKECLVATYNAAENSESGTPITGACFNGDTEVKTFECEKNLGTTLCHDPFE